MSMALIRVGWILLLMNPSAVELSVYIVVVGCLCLIYSIIICMYAASMEAIHRAPSSASDADDMTLFMICAMVSIAPFFGGIFVFFYNKKCPPSRMHASGSLR